MLKEDEESHDRNTYVFELKTTEKMNKDGRAIDEMGWKEIYTKAIEENKYPRKHCQCLVAVSIASYRTVCITKIEEGNEEEEKKQDEYQKRMGGKKEESGILTNQYFGILLQRSPGKQIRRRSCL